MISDILALTNMATQAANSVGNTLRENKNAVLKLQGKANSISRMAKKRIYEYPVVVSNAMGDNVEATYTIVKYAEAIFGYFLMMCMGLEPVVGSGNSIGMHLANYGTEDFDIKLTLPDGDSVKLTLEEANYILSQSKPALSTSEVLSGNKFETAEENLYSNRPIREEDIQFKPGNSGRWYDTDTLQPVNEFGFRIDSSGNILHDPVNNRPVKAKNYAQGTVSTDIKYTVDKSLNRDSLAIRNFPKNMEDRMGKSLPTTVTIDLFVADQKVPVTLSVKTIPHIIDSSEMKELCTKTVMGGSFRSKLIRLRTGELSLFRDIIFNLNEIQKDKIFYQRMMRHPWIKQLETGKLKSSGKTLLKMIPLIKEFVAEKGGVLPSVSLVTTIHEISDAFSMPYKDVENRKLLFKVMDNLMLLAMFIFDPEHEMVYCYYSGIPNIYKLPLKDLSAKDKSDTERMLEAMKIMMMNR